MGCCSNASKFSTAKDKEALISIINETILDFENKLRLSIEDKHEENIQTFQTVINDTKEFLSHIRRKKEIDFCYLKDNLEDFYEYFNDNSIKGQFQKKRSDILKYLKSEF